MREHPRKKKDEHSLPSPLLPANMTLEVTLNSTQDVIRRTSAPRMFIDMIAKQNLNNRAFAIFLYRVLFFLCDFPTLAYTSFPAKLIIDYFRVTCMTTSRTVYKKEIKREIELRKYSSCALYTLVGVLVEQLCTNPIRLSNLLNNGALFLGRLWFTSGGWLPIGRGFAVVARGPVLRLFI